MNNKMKSLRTLLLPIVVAPNDDGYLARCPNIQGAFAEGDTIEEAIFNCIDVVKMIYQYRKERGETIEAPGIEITSENQLAFSMPMGIE